MRPLLRAATALASISATTLASAQPAPVTLGIPEGAGQQALALRIDAAGIRARVCAAAAGCAADGAATVPVPEGVLPLLGKARATALRLAGGRALAGVEVPGEAGAVWRALLAAPASGADPLVVWSGWTRAVKGEHGEEHATEVVVEPLPQGGTRVLVGERRADVTLCGRPTLVGAREIDPATLTLGRAAAVQNLGADERAAATPITAARAKGEAPKGEVRLLRATAASSAFEKRLSAISDGDPATAWSENKPGEGRGEFVSFSSADEVGVRAIDLVVRPLAEKGSPAADVPGGAAPKRFYLATPDRVFAVSMPEDAWKQPPGTHYTVPLPAELRASCLAVVLDEAYAPAGKADVRVTLAEVEARTAFDGAPLEAIAGALSGGGERAQAAAALLARAGLAGPRAAMAAYEKLDEAGRRLAAGVIDAAPCKEQGPFFAARFAASLAGPAPRGRADDDRDPELTHARDQVRRCGRAAAETLAKAVAEGGPRAKIAAADELAALAPDLAVPALLDALATSDDAVRRDLRAALARAAKSPRAGGALAAEIARLGGRSEVVAIDLFRAAAPVAGAVEGAADAFAALAGKSTSFRARYLLQAPAAELASRGDARAEGYLRAALRKDEDAHVRARAAEVAARLPALAADMLGAVEDADARVREAAIVALGEARRDPTPELVTALGRRLASDEWTFVRAGAAKALGAMPAAAAVDATLAAALRDRAPAVREQALDALGAHRAAAHVDAIRERQDDDEEATEVRARAMLALAALCDTRSLSLWTKLARVGRQPFDDRERRLAGAAIAALGDVHPRDLGERLAPLLDRDAPGPVREMARAALAAPGCTR